MDVMLSQCRKGLGRLLPQARCTRRKNITTDSKPSDPAAARMGGAWSHPPSTSTISDTEIARLAARPRRPVLLADLVKNGRPPLSEEALLSSANYTLKHLPTRLAHRIQSLRNLPFIVVANPHISQIYNNYLHSVETLGPFYRRDITTLAEEEKFTDVLADLVQTHSNTIPTLAQGFLECKKYIDAAEVTRFLDSHLRARIGTRLLAEQHIALHLTSTLAARQQEPLPNHIGIIDTALRPAEIVLSCEHFVGEICELKYGIRPHVKLGGTVEAEFAHVPVHLEYIVTELLKNAFRATVESGHEDRPIEITIAAAPDVSHSKLDSLKQLEFAEHSVYDFTRDGVDEYCADSAVVREPLHKASQSITLRIRDSGGGIAPEVLPNIWAYSFTTFNADQAATTGAVDGLNAITNGGNPSSIAGLGYGLPLSRAYAEYFGGSIAVHSMHGWGTDVYLTLQGLGKIA